MYLLTVWCYLFIYVVFNDWGRFDSNVLKRHEGLLLFFCVMYVCFSFVCFFFSSESLENSLMFVRQ